MVCSIGLIQKYIVETAVFGKKKGQITGDFRKYVCRLELRYVSP
jgi:hypothetical protein